MVTSNDTKSTFNKCASKWRRQIPQSDKSCLWIAYSLANVLFNDEIVKIVPQMHLNNF